MRLGRRYPAAVLALAAAALVLPAAPVTAAGGKWRTSVRTIAGHDVAATPDAYDKITYERHWFGGKKPKPPKAVVILVPGFFGGAANFRYVGERLVTRDPRLQVWALERRTNAFENRCGMERAEQGASYAGLSGLALYQLQGIDIYGEQNGEPVCPRPEDDPDPTMWDGIDTEFFLEQEEAGALGFADFGLETALSDVRAVVRRAHELYPGAKVVLGGHSLGGMTTQAYAGWRFGKGKRSAGWRDLDGIVMIDGSMDGTQWADVLLPQHFEREDELAQGIYYWERAEAGYLLGYLAEIGGMAAIFGAELESFLWSSLEGTPLRWPDPATCPTNKAVFAALTDDEYGFSGTFMSHQGELLAPVDLDQNGESDTCAGTNSDRLLAHWSDFDETGEFSSTDRWAHLTFEGAAPNFAEWFFPIALNSEMDLAHNLDSKATYLNEPTQTETTAADSFGHRIFDTARVKLPAFGFVTANCMERYEWYGSEATRLTDYTLVDRSQEHCGDDAGEDWAHLDPLLAEDEGDHRNDFVRTLLRWLDDQVL